MQPRVAIGPEPVEWIREAIRNAAGDVVDIDDNPNALVWTSPEAPEELAGLLANRPQIEWVQLPIAGIERFVEAGVVDGDRRWTSAKGAFAEPVAEHALALTLAGLRLLAQRARAHSWGRPAGESLFDQPVTIVGGGGIATALIELLTPFRAKITVVRKRPAKVAGAVTTVGPQHLNASLARARVVVLALAQTPETRLMFGRTQFDLMAPDAWLINVARGGVVSTDDLVEALRSGAIGGAALDVTDPEPLPDGHPLWDLPNCLITPHCADTDEMIRPLLARRIEENVGRFASGHELVGLVNLELGY